MWFYNGVIVEELPDDCVGYIYLITNTVSGKKYIGKKLSHFSKTKYKTVKLKNGKKKRKKIRSKIESDWQTYWSSSEELKKDVKNLGESNFTREILKFCKSKSELSYYEAKIQFERKVLESNEYYNGHIRVRVHKNHINGKIDK